MNGENQSLVTYDEQVEVQDFRRNIDRFRGIYRTYPQINKEKLKDVNM
jgi:hypothetical protein